MNIYRKIAIDFLSIHDTFNIANPEELCDILEDSGELFDELDINSPSNNELIINLYKYNLRGVTNCFLESRLASLTSQTFNVIGEADILQACPCCSYRTLSQRGEYDICEVCRWEDVGNIDENQYSGANSSTLNNARTVFKLALIEKNVSPMLLKKYYLDNSHSAFSSNF